MSFATAFPDHSEFPQLGSVIPRLRNAGCVFAEEEAGLLVSAAATPDELEQMILRRIAGLPLEHILGWVEFCGLRIGIDPGVFVPRQRTEFLVLAAAELCPDDAIVVDLCCGTGALGVALDSRVLRMTLLAADIESAAVRCAKRNIEPIGGIVLEGDLYGPLPAELAGTIDILISNAPYVPTMAIELMPPEARLYEPRIALDGGDDGLDVQRRVAKGALEWLAPGGSLLVETSEAQACATESIFAENGLRPTILSSEAYEATVVIGTAPSAPSRG